MRVLLARLRTYTHVQHSPRSDSPQCFVRVEHGARVLGEGGKVVYTCDAGEGVMSGVVEVRLECDSSQRQSIDDLIKNPNLRSVTLE